MCFLLTPACTISGNMKAYILISVLLPLALSEDLSLTPDNQEVLYDFYLKSAPSKECGDLMVKSDQCVQDTLFMAKSMKIPETEDEIDDYCGKLKETVSCVSSYRQCLKAFPKQLFNIVVRDIKKQMKLICSSSAKKKEALGHLKCFEEKHREFLIGVLNGVTNVLFNISAPSGDPQTLIPKSCCAYHILVDKAVIMVDQECKPRTGLETGVFVSELIRSVVSALTDLACGTHNSVKVCQKLLPYESKHYIELMDNGMDKRFSFSPILPIIRILNILDSRINLRK